MVNLPKPSKLNLKGTASEQSAYILTYLQQLVSELEKILGSVNKSSQSESLPAITDIYFSQNALVIIRADGSQQKVEC